MMGKVKYSPTQKLSFTMSVEVPAPMLSNTMSYHSSAMEITPSLGDRFLYRFAGEGQ